MLQRFITMVFTSMMGLFCLYSFISFCIITVNRMRLSKGIFRDFIDKLMIISGMGFILTLWLLILKINGVEDSPSMLFTNILLMALITGIAYTSFSINKITKTFGFKRFEDEIRLNLNKELKKLKKK